MLKALEDPEQRAQGHACGCPSKHAQGQVTVTVSVPFTDDDLVGRLLSINSCIWVLVWHCIRLPVGGIDNLSSCWVRATVWTIAVDLRGRCSIGCVGRRRRGHCSLFRQDCGANISCVCSGILQCKLPCQAIVCALCTETDGLPVSADDLQQTVSGLPIWRLDVPTLMPRADIDAVHGHVDLILYALPSLVIVVDQVTV